MTFFSSAFAEIEQVNLLDRNGNIVEQYSLSLVGTEVSKTNERMKFYWYCWSKKMFNSLTCDFVNSKVDGVVTENVFSQQVHTKSLPIVGTQTDSPVTTKQTQQVGNQVIYQVIERAVPGPIGPAGRDGADYYGPQQSNQNNTQFLSQYSTSPNYSPEYIGFGAGSNASGDANLNSIVGAGLGGCNSSTQKILYNSTTKLFECGTDLNAGGSAFAGGDISAQNIFATTTLQTPTIFASTTNSSSSNIFTGNITNLVSNVATLTSATATNLFSNNASITNSTSTIHFSAMFSSLFSNIANLLFTNATGTNATTTNFFSNNITSTGISNIFSLFGNLATFTSATTTNFFGESVFNTNLINSGTFALATGTIASATLNYANTSNLLVGNVIGNVATFTSGTTTNWHATNLWVSNASFTSASSSNLVAGNATFSYATVTNGFFTNLSVTGSVDAALTNGFVFRGNASNISEATSTIFVANNGKVGIGSTTPTEKFSVQGNLLVSGDIVTPKFTGLNDSGGSDKILCINSAGTVTKDDSANCYNSYSDIRLKTNIATVTNSLEKVRELNTVNFNWIDVAKGTTTQLGYIAQDVAKVFPEVVKTDETGFLKVNYVSLSAIYANAIKELDRLVFENINIILNKLIKHEEEILDLKIRVNKLEALNGVKQSETVDQITPEDRPALPEEQVVEEITPDTASAGEPTLSEDTAVTPNNLE